MKNPLQTARIVVIDDSEEEAAPLVLTLARMGLGAWYFTGDFEHLPDSPLSGIRVVFLDLRLAGAKTDHDAIPHTLSVLEKIIGTNSRSTAIVFWSKHPESITEFRERLGRVMPLLNPAFVFRIESKTQLVGLGENGYEQIRKQIETAFEHGPATSMLHEWERVIHEASDATFESLTSLAAGDNGQLDQVKLMNLLGAVAASIGSDTNSLTVSRVPTVLFEALAPIHFDQVSQARCIFPEGDVRATSLKTAISNPQQQTDDQRAKINSALLTAPIADLASPFQPGDVFLHRPVLGTKCPHHHCVIKKRDMVRGFDFNADETWKKLKQRLRAANGAEETEIKAEMSHREKAVVDCWQSVLVELTPACDFAQRKRETVRFIGGILIPAEHEKFIPGRSDYLRRLPTVALQEPKGSWILVLNSRFLFGISRPSEKVDSKPAFRLRNRVLIDIQAWVASQVARPGYDFL